MRLLLVGGCLHASVPIVHFLFFGFPLSRQMSSLCLFFSGKNLAATYMGHDIFVQSMYVVFCFF